MRVTVLSGPLAAILPLSPRRFELPAPVGVNLPLVPGELLINALSDNGLCAAIRRERVQH